MLGKYHLVAYAFIKQFFEVMFDIIFMFRDGCREADLVCASSWVEIPYLRQLQLIF